MSISDKTKIVTSNVFLHHYLKRYLLSSKTYPTISKKSDFFLLLHWTNVLKINE